MATKVLWGAVSPEFARQVAKLAKRDLITAQATDPNYTYNETTNGCDCTGAVCKPPIYFRTINASSTELCDTTDDCDSPKVCVPVNFVIGFEVGTGDGETTEFDLGHSNIADSSVKMYACNRQIKIFSRNMAAVTGTMTIAVA